MKKFSALLSVILSLFVLTGCVNTPTEMVQVKDDRPFIMFAAAQPGDVVMLDGIDMGAASHYSAGKSGMRIEPGTHTIQVKRSGVVVLSEKFYVADGVSKTFNIGGGE